MESTYPSCFLNAFIYFFEKGFLTYNIKFFGYINHLIVFNSDNFKDF